MLGLMFTPSLNLKLSEKSGKKMHDQLISKAYCPIQPKSRSSCKKRETKDVKPSQFVHFLSQN